MSIAVGFLHFLPTCFNKNLMFFRSLTMLILDWHYQLGGFLSGCNSGEGWLVCWTGFSECGLWFKPKNLSALIWAQLSAYFFITTFCWATYPEATSCYMVVYHITKKFNSLLSLSKEDIVFKSVYGCLFTQVSELVILILDFFWCLQGLWISWQFICFDISFGEKLWNGFIGSQSKMPSSSVWSNWLWKIFSH